MFALRNSSLLLLKMDLEIPELDSNGNESPSGFVSAQELKVGKMEGAIDGSPAGLNIDNDIDRFYIRIPGAASLQSASVRLSTENPDSTYNDDATEIELEVDSNDLVSKSLLLVSDDEDDDESNHSIGTDDAKNDRTHKVQLGGSVKIESLIINEQEYDTKISLKVKTRGTIDLRF